jgi:putative CocE/NonD family hydrolase
MSSKPVAARAVAVSLVALGFVAVAAAAPVRVDTNVNAKMRDGVELTADVYRPDAEGRFPTLLERTPYDRKGATPDAMILAAAGYAVVIQDTRGRFGSEGEFYPFRHEAQDGHDTIEWAATQPWSNGRVGMFGGSYVGATQMLAATTTPPHLVAVFPYVTASEYYEGWTYQGGALMEWFASSWTSGLSVDTLRRKAAPGKGPLEWVKQEPIATYPLLSLPSPKDLAPYFRDWAAHETDDDYWRAVKVKDHYGEIAVKGLHAGGWHDIFLRGTIENYLGLREKAATEDAREGQRLLLGPWAHAPTSPEGKIGDVVFGKAAVLDMAATIRDWSDYSLKGVANRFAGKRVHLFVMGDDIWRDEDEFPLARAKETRFFLAPGTSRETGRLADKAPRKAAPSEYDYDPADPVPTLGGRLCCGDAMSPGPTDQRANESRKDVLVFSTPPFARDTEVTGFLSFELFAASSAPDTDFTGLLADVGPDGYARFLTDGILRARYRKSTAGPPVALVPGQVEKYKIDLWATSNVFKVGHRMRLYVSSSNFPRFDRNRNTGAPILEATGGTKAHQTVYHDALRPSALVVPVVPR